MVSNVLDLTLQKMLGDGSHGGWTKEGGDGRTEAGGWIGSGAAVTCHPVATQVTEGQRWFLC